MIFRCVFVVLLAHVSIPVSSCGLGEKHVAGVGCVGCEAGEHYVAVVHADML